MRVSTPRYKGRMVLGLPPSHQAILFSNSDRTDSACDRKWWLRKPERLKPISKAAPLRFGSGWDLFTEDLAAWHMVHDSTYPGLGMECPWCAGAGKGLDDEGPWECNECNGTGAGPVERTIRGWHADLDKAIHEAGMARDPKAVKEVEEMSERLMRVADGYIRRTGGDPHPRMQVVAVKLQLAAPIRDPRSGAIYTGRMYLVRDRLGRMRIAHTGEAAGRLPKGLELIDARWPWYQVGELDNVLKSRTSEALFVGERKSSADPRGYITKLEIDPQVTGYTWLLREALDAGLLVESSHNHVGGMVPGQRIGGYVYDVAHSGMQYDPIRLKPKKPTKKNPIPPPPEFSVARNRTVPSWRFRDALDGAPELDHSEYADHITWLERNIDPKLYIGDTNLIGPEDVQRYQVELYGVVRAEANRWRRAGRVRDAVDVEIEFPRRAICRLPGGGCAYSRPCMKDGPKVREFFERQEPLEWHRGESP